MCYILPPLLFRLRLSSPFVLVLLLSLPFGKRPLAFVALKIGLHIGEQTTGKGF